jgi:5'-nucleotidase
MGTHMHRFVVALALVGVVLSGCTRKTSRDQIAGGRQPVVTPSPSPTASPQPEPTPNPTATATSVPTSEFIQLTVVGTNDMHGGVEPSETRDGKPIGGMAFMAGVVKSIREGLRRQTGEGNSGVVVLDAGDQFQGTLLSNFDEGKLLFEAMSEIGYDAAVPGNHDYDFGPVGWTIDQVAGTTEAELRGAFRETIKKATFPMVSANTFLKSSIKDAAGNAIPVDGIDCKPIVAQGQAAPEIDWSKAETLDFLKPYVIKQVAGLRVAIVGLDNPTTPKVTTPHNVSDLCFEDEVEAYLRVRKQLEGQADVFLVTIHNGNINTDHNATKFVEKVKAAPSFSDGAAVLDAVIAGHTHTVNNLTTAGVPIVQSGSGGKLFGRIDLFYNRAAKKVDQSKTKRWAGIQMIHSACTGEAGRMCTVDGDGNVSYEGVAVEQNARVLELIAGRRQEIAPIAAKVLGTASATIDRFGPNESPLANYLTDYLRRAAGDAHVAFMNSGGIRAPLNPRGLPNFPVTYEALFQVLPFSNRGVVIAPMPVDKLVSVLQRSARVCNADGSMQQSGLRITVTRNCRNPDGSVRNHDDNAVITRVALADAPADVLVDNGQIVDPARVVTVVTLDFLKAGGSGYTQFADIPLLRDLGIVRDVIADMMAQAPVQFTTEIDGRWTIIDQSQSTRR